MKINRKLLFEFVLDSEEVRKAIYEAFRFQSNTDWPQLEDVEFDYQIINSDPLGMKIEIVGSLKMKVPN